MLFVFTKQQNFTFFQESLFTLEKEVCKLVSCFLVIFWATVDIFPLLIFLNNATALSSSKSLMEDRVVPLCLRITLMIDY